MTGGEGLALDQLLMTDERVCFYCDGSIYDMDVVESDGPLIAYAAHADRQSYFGIALVYDIQSRSSFVEMSRSYDMIRQNSGDHAPPFGIAVLGLKADLERVEGSVSREEGERFARDRGCYFAECSAKTGEGVREAFGSLVESVHGMRMQEPAGSKALIEEGRRTFLRILTAKGA